MEKQNKIITVAYKHNWVVSKSSEVAAISHKGKFVMLLSRQFVDLAEIGFRTTDDGDLQLSVAGQPSMILLGNRR